MPVTFAAKIVQFYKSHLKKSRSAKSLLVSLTKMLNKFFSLSVAFLFATVLSAQITYKYGHMNLGNLVADMPDVVAANATLKTFAERFTAIDDSLTSAFQKDYEKLVADYQAGLLTQVAAQKAQEDLEKRKAYIEAFEEDSEQKVNAKRQEILAPILKKVQDAVDTVAKENGYHLVFDTGSGVALYALETEDITPLVKKKLGL